MRDKVDLRCPDSPLAKQLRQRFYEMLRCNVKLGKRTLSEFRADQSTSTYNIHVLVSSDGQRWFCVRSCFLIQFIFACLWWKTAKSLPGISRLSGTSVMLFSMLTSSTAQGGGGSFKNRKPIGEIGCCESGMAERSH